MAAAAIGEREFASSSVRPFISKSNDRFFNHSSWNGLTVADLVFPWFIFMMGVAMSFTRVREARTTALWRVVKRSSKLMCARVRRCALSSAKSFAHTHAQSSRSVPQQHARHLHGQRRALPRRASTLWHRVSRRLARRTLCASHRCARRLVRQCLAVAVGASLRFLAITNRKRRFS